MLDTPHRAVIVAVFCWAVAPLWSKPAVAQPSVVKTEVSGTAFRIALSDGSVTQGRSILRRRGAGFRYRWQAGPCPRSSITPDQNDKAVLLHDLRVDATDTPLCRPDPDGKQLGFPLAGRTAPDGRFVEAGPGVFELVCLGAQGKCVRFGYHPWESAPDGQPMRDYFDACVRMVRADYCGDGHGWTRDGTLIDVWDDRGIQKTDATSNPMLSFEAGWRPDSAVCVAHTRIPENITLDKLKASCPRLAIVPPCDEPSARAAGALFQSVAMMHLIGRAAARAGTGAFYTTDGQGEITLLKTHTGWVSPAGIPWKQIISFYDYSYADSGLLIYDGAGTGAFYRYDGRGGIAWVRTHSNLPSGRIDVTSSARSGFAAFARSLNAESTIL